MHKIVNGVKIDLTPEEIKEFKEREVQFAEEKAKKDKTAYLEKRKFDPDMPSLEEKIDAIYEKIVNSDDALLDKVKAKIDKVKQKHPKPVKE